MKSTAEPPRASKMADGREIVIANRQRTRRLDRKYIERFCKWIANDFEQFELGIHFVSAKEMARVHEQFMSIAGSTDVITFDHGSQSARRIHGEVFISVEDAIEQAHAFRTTWQDEIARYIIHGVLHLQGFDDLKPKLRARMKQSENRWMRRAKAEFDLAAFERA